MVEIHVHQDRDGCRSYIMQGRKVTVIDGFFQDDRKDIKTTRPINPYLFGT